MCNGPKTKIDHVIELVLVVVALPLFLLLYPVWWTARATMVVVLNARDPARPG